MGLQEHGKIPRFQEIQLQSMIALIVSQPLKMGHWFSAIFFDGDLSQPQRSTILTALGLSARELGGNGEADAKALGLPRVSDASFPSKKLPGNLEALYQPETESPITSLTKQLSRASLEPLAADASDSLSGPNALKVRTFSSRMEVEKKRQQREAQRQKSTAKDLYRVLADGFFYPLKGRFEMMIMQFSSYVLLPPQVFHKSSSLTNQFHRSLLQPLLCPPSPQSLHPNTHTHPLNNGPSHAPSRSRHTRNIDISALAPRSPYIRRSRHLVLASISLPRSCRLERRLRDLRGRAPGH